MIKRSKVWVAALLAANMVVSQPALVLAQDVPADSEEIFLETDDEEYFSTDEDVTEEADFEFDMDLEEEALEEAELAEEEGVEEEAMLEETGTGSGGFALSAEQMTFKNNVISHADERNISTLKEGKDYAAGEVITLAFSRENAEAIAAAYNGKLKDFGYGVATISLEDSDYTVAEAYNAGISKSELPAVEPNYYYVIPDPVNEKDGTEFESKSAFAPADWDRIYNDWGYDDPALNPANNNVDGITYQWFHDMINTYSAWAVSTGDPNVIVAVIDSGVRDTHEELSGKVIIPSDLSLHFAHNDDRLEHGTHVASIIAGKLDNGKGGAGIAPECKILGINATYYEPSMDDYVFAAEDEAKSILYVAGYNESGTKQPERRAEIINMSLGGMGYSAVVDDACKKAAEAEITILAAMGNEYANAIDYPAGYDDVIAVGAVNQLGEKTIFSNYGSWCDIAAPGQEIYSAISADDSAYEALDGTSMATPVVAGACALYMSVNGGHVSPKDMKDALIKHASKTSSKQIGAGIVDLAKMLGGDVNAPTVTVTDKEGNSLGTAKGDTLTVQGVQSLETLISLDSNNFGGDEELNQNTKFVFTTNGKDPVLKNGKLSNGSWANYSYWHKYSYSLATYLGRSEKQRDVTLKFATVSGMGVISKISTVKIKVEGTTVGSYFYITGQGAIPKGTSATYKVVFYGKAVKNKKVTWDLDTEAKENGASVKNGKVTIPATYPDSSITIYATGELGTESLTVNTPDQKVNSVVITVSGEQDFNKVVKNKKTGSATSATLYNVNIDSEAFPTDESKLYVSANYLDKDGKGVTGSSFSYSSSNSSVAYVYYDEITGRDYIKAFSPGTAKITFTARDGSNKKATIKVNVITPASHMTVLGKNDQTRYLAQGKSVTIRAIPGDVYGKPTNSKVKWSYKIYLAPYDEEKQDYVPVKEPFDENTAKAIMKDKIFSFSNGKLKVGSVANFKKSYSTYTDGMNALMVFEAIATTADGTNYSDSAKYMCVPATTKIEAYGYDQNGAVVEKHQTNWGIPVTQEEGTIVIKSNGIPMFEVTSSDPEIISASVNSKSILQVVPHKTGTASVKIRAMDGTNKSITLKITVYDPES